jgi:tetratricopeptide (TPR) repeat protein
MNRFSLTPAFMALLTCATGTSALAEQMPGLRLAIDLSQTGDHASSAVEFRRLAAEASHADRAAWFWMAGRAYLLNGDTVRANTMLDRMDDSGIELKPFNSLLRAEVARKQNDSAQARFYYESFLRSNPENESARFARFRLSEIHARSGQIDEARLSLEGVENADEALDSLADYSRGRDKSPVVGGALGLVPGLGYFYSGEIANGVRSMILNGLFIWGMTEMAAEENWGGFAVVTFFELTWYSGSIYGGVDSAHRYNRRRVEAMTEHLGRDASIEPRMDVLPALKLSVRW